MMQNYRQEITKVSRKFKGSVKRRFGLRVGYLSFNQNWLALSIGSF